MNRYSSNAILSKTLSKEDRKNDTNSRLKHQQMRSYINTETKVVPVHAGSTLASASEALSAALAGKGSAATVLDSPIREKLESMKGRTSSSAVSGQTNPSGASARAALLLGKAKQIINTQPLNALEPGHSINSKNNSSISNRFDESDEDDFDFKKTKLQSKEIKKSLQLHPGGAHSKFVSDTGPLSTAGALSKNSISSSKNSSSSSSGGELFGSSSSSSKSLETSRGIGSIGDLKSNSTIKTLNPGNSNIKTANNNANGTRNNPFAVDITSSYESSKSSETLAGLADNTLSNANRSNSSSVDGPRIIKDNSTHTHTNTNTNKDESSNILSTIAINYDKSTSTTGGSKSASSSPRMPSANPFRVDSVVSTGIKSRVISESNSNNSKTNAANTNNIEADRNIADGGSIGAMKPLNNSSNSSKLVSKTETMSNDQDKINPNKNDFAIANTSISVNSTRMTNNSASFSTAAPTLYSEKNSRSSSLSTSNSSSHTTTTTTNNISSLNRISSSSSTDANSSSGSNNFGGNSTENSKAKIDKFENFVRLNMKKRKFTYKNNRKTGKFSKNPRIAQFKSRGGYEASFGSGGAIRGDDSNDDSDDNVNTESSGRAYGGGLQSAMTASDADYSGSNISNLNLDSVQLLLDKIVLFCNLNENEYNKSIEISNLNQHISQRNETSKHPSTFYKYNKLPDYQNEKISHSYMTSFLLNISELVNSQRLDCVKTFSDVDLFLSSIARVAQVPGQGVLPAPKCTGHNMASKLLVVKKTGANKGRKFYCCSYPYDQKCNYFLWFENNPLLLDLLVKDPIVSNQKNSSMGDHFSDDLDEISMVTDLVASNIYGCGSIDRSLLILQNFEVKLKQMNMVQINDQLKQLESRINNILDTIASTYKKTDKEFYQFGEDCRIKLDEIKSSKAVIRSSTNGGKAQKSSAADKKAHLIMLIMRIADLILSITDKFGSSINRDTLKSFSGIDGSEGFDSIAATGYDDLASDAAPLKVSKSNNAMNLDRNLGEDNLNLGEKRPLANEVSTVSKKNSLSTCNNLSSNIELSAAKLTSPKDGNDSIYLSMSDSDSGVQLSDDSESSNDSEDESDDASVTLSDVVDQADVVEDLSNQAMASLPFSSDVSGSRRRNNLPLLSNGRDKLTPDSALNLLFNFPFFRPGQRESIVKTLAGENSLLLLPTGGGKSVAFSIPAIILPGVTIIISPLIALIDDQLDHLPLEVTAIRWNSSLNTSSINGKTSSISGSLLSHYYCMMGVLSGLIKIIYISPESYASRSFQNFIELLNFVSYCKHHMLSLVGGSSTVKDTYSLTESDSKLATDTSSRNNCGASSHGGARHKREHPAISLLCLDEAHCVSRWSFCFRPDFLKIGRLSANSDAYACLAVTATSTPQVESDLCTHLRIERSAIQESELNDQKEEVGEINEASGTVVKGKNIPKKSKEGKYQANKSAIGSESGQISNQVGVIRVSDNKEHIKLNTLVCGESEKFNEITKLLESINDKINNSGKSKSRDYVNDPNLSDCDENDYIGGRDSKSATSKSGASSKAAKFPHTIIYCWRKVDCERLSHYLVSRGYACAFYHGSLSATERQRALNGFRSGATRILTCSIALSLGLDLPQTRSVLHLQVPGSIEAYVQETGRAGRDGSESHCYLLLDPSGIPSVKEGSSSSSAGSIRQYSMSLGDSLSKLQVLVFLLMVLQNSGNRLILGVNQTTPSIVNLSSIARNTGLSVSTVETLMLLLELQPFGFITCKNKRHDIIKGRFRDLTTVQAMKISMAESNSNSIYLTQLRLNDFKAAIETMKSLNKIPRSLASAQDDSFELSLNELSESLNLSIESASRMLYDMQAQGLIFYNSRLADSKREGRQDSGASEDMARMNYNNNDMSSSFNDWFYDIYIDWDAIVKYPRVNKNSEIDINADAPENQAQPIVKYDYFDILISISQVFFDFVDNLNAGVRNRVIDMYKLAVFMDNTSRAGIRPSNKAANSLDMSEKGSNQSNQIIREVIRYYLSLPIDTSPIAIPTQKLPSKGYSETFNSSWSEYCAIRTSIQIFPTQLLCSLLNIYAVSTNYDSSAISRFSLYPDNGQANSFLMQFINDVFISSRDALIDGYISQLSNNCITAVRKVNTAAPSFNEDGNKEDLFRQFQELRGPLYELYNDAKVRSRALCIAKLFHGVPFSTAPISGTTNLFSSSSSSSSSFDDTDGSSLLNSMKSHMCFSKYSGYEFRSLLDAVAIALANPTPQLGVDNNNSYYHRGNISYR